MKTLNKVSLKLGFDGGFESKIIIKWLLDIQLFSLKGKY